MRSNRLESVILLILASGEMYGRAIRVEYYKKTGKSLLLGSLYSALDRMEERGLVKSREAEPLLGYGGHRRRYYSLV